jgi:toxin ParE1/3/4
MSSNATDADISAFRIEEAADRRIDDIYNDTYDRWGEDQVNRYIRGLFDTFATFRTVGDRSRPVPAAFGITAFVCRYRHHYIHWRDLPGGGIGIVTVLHESTHQMARFRDDLPR